MPFTDVAFAAGFASIRQFNDTVREVYAQSPTELRAQVRTVPPSGSAIHLRLPYRAPVAWDEMLGFLGHRAIAGVEEIDGDTYRRVLDLAHGAAVAEVAPGDGHVACTLTLDDVRDLAQAVATVRRLLDLDADPVAIDDDARRRSGARAARRCATRPARARGRGPARAGRSARCSASRFRWSAPARSRAGWSSATARR